MTEAPLDQRETTRQADLPGAPFGGGARDNPDDWIPLVDLMEIFGGFRYVDDHGFYDLHDAPIGVSLRIEEANKTDPILKAEMEWEERKMRPLGIWKKDGQFHLVYNASGSPLVTCYAVSEDGYNWTRPELGQVEFKGSKKNNIVADGPKGGIFQDPNAPPEERFKAMSQDMFWVDPETAKIVTGDEADKRLEAQKREGRDYKGPTMQLRAHLIGWTSPDGVHWMRIKEPLAPLAADSGSHPKYDPSTGYYFDYFRVHAKPPEEYSGIGTGVPETNLRRRSIGFSRTKDFRQWPPPKLVLFPDAQDNMDVSFYGTEYFRYPGRNDLHGMLVSLFHQINDHMDAQIAFSRDGLYWYRPERRAIVPVGQPGDGDEGMTYPATTLVELPDGYWGFLCRGGSRLHNVWPDDNPDLFPKDQPPTINWARWRPHRFCGIEAESEGGFTILTTKRTQQQLRLNYRCEPGGWISVELNDNTPTATRPPRTGFSGFTFGECDRVMGDSEDTVVTWGGKSDISEVGDSVAIRIKMFRAKLFAFRV